MPGITKGFTFRGFSIRPSRYLESLNLQRTIEEAFCRRRMERKEKGGEEKSERRVRKRRVGGKEEKKRELKGRWYEAVKGRAIWKSNMFQDS